MPIGQDVTVAEPSLRKQTITYRFVMFSGQKKEKKLSFLICRLVVEAKYLRGSNLPSGDSVYV